MEPENILTIVVSLEESQQFIEVNDSIHIVAIGSSTKITCESDIVAIGSNTKITGESILKHAFFSV